MTTIKKTIFITLLCASYSTIAMAQNLRTMPVAERNALLISIAKEVVLIHGPDYYREYGEPVITRGQAPPEGYFDGKNANRHFYTINFPYDKTQETLGMDFVASVSIWEDTGQPFFVLFANGWGRVFEGDNWQSVNEELGPAFFEQIVPFPIYDWDNPDPNQVPRNIEELTRRGLVRDNDGNWVRTRPDEPPAEAQRVIRRAQEELRQRQAQREREASGERNRR